MLMVTGATGTIGRPLVDLLALTGPQSLTHEELVAGIGEVERILGRPARTYAEWVRFVTADLAAADPAALQSAVQGADAVLSGLGPRSASEAGVASQGTRAIVQAMQATHVRRIVVSAAPISTVPVPGRPEPPKHDPGDGFFMRNLFSPFEQPGSARPMPTSP